MFSFECDCSAYLDDHNQLHDITYPCAMFEHECGECGRVIKPGEHYERVRILYDGDWETAKTCLGCWRIRERFCSNGHHYGCLAEQMTTCLGFNYTADPATYPEDDEPGGRWRD
jgi:hypothetical protein